MNSESSIWRKILLVDSVILVVTGALFTTLPFLDEKFVLAMYNMVYGASLGVNDQSLQYLNMILGVSGAVMIGWGATITFLSYYMLKNDDIEAIWTAVTIGLVVWFIEDVFVSVMFGAIYNVVFNVGFLLLFLIPIIGRKYL